MLLLGQKFVEIFFKNLKKKGGLSSSIFDSYTIPLFLEIQSRAWGKKIPIRCSKFMFIIIVGMGTNLVDR